MEGMHRLKSGIPGLDEITRGGIPEKQLVLLTGTAGTGKTTFGCQFVYFGAKKFKQNGVYLSFEEPAEQIREHAKNFGWNFSALERKNKIRILRYDPYRVADILDLLESSIREIHAERVVIDSISALGLYVGAKTELRRLIFDISQTLRRLGCTSILISEIVHGSKGISRYGVEEFVADSVIVLYYKLWHSAFKRAIHVWKLANSNHSLKVHPYKIRKDGIRIDHTEEAFVEPQS